MSIPSPTTMANMFKEASLEELIKERDRVIDQMKKFEKEVVTRKNRVYSQFYYDWYIENLTELLKILVERYHEERAKIWEQRAEQKKELESFLKQMPEDNYTISLLRDELSSFELELLKNDVFPEYMEDKWTVLYKDDKLYFYRSWAGYLIFIVNLRNQTVTVNNNTEQYSECGDKRKTLDYVNSLIDMLLVI